MKEFLHTHFFVTLFIRQALTSVNYPSRESPHPKAPSTLIEEFINFNPLKPSKKPTQTAGFLKFNL